MTTPLLSVRNLNVKYPTRFGEFTAIENFNLTLDKGEIHGLVGESGAGKSTVGSAVIGLLQYPGYIETGTLELTGDNLLHLNDAAYHRLRGQRISMIFQDPQTSLNPLLSIAAQLIETICQHKKINAKAARNKAIDLLIEVGLDDAANRIDDYPHQFSGGMRQRVVIALALCTEPELIIADEPTTALDVSVQKQILNLIRSLAKERGVGFILITHDIGVIAEITDSVTVLRSGRIVESGTTTSVLSTPKQDYTRALIQAVPRLDQRLNRFSNIVTADTHVSGDHNWSVSGASASHASDWLLTNQDNELNGGINHCIMSVQNLDVTFYSDKPHWFARESGLQALSGISLEMYSGEVLGVVGESGSGKSTLAKAIAGLVKPSAGDMQFRGKPLPAGKKRHRRHPSRRQIQMVFQDPYSSLNNRRTVEQIISEPIRFYATATNRQEIKRLVGSMLELVEMPQRAMLKYPHQFSGGQRQRIAVARALVARPEFLICDEPTSSLDVSIQAQILNLLKDLQSAFGLSILFISHNLAVIRQMADRIVVLKDGMLVETADNEEFFSAPQHPYSQTLLRETPSLTNQR